MATDRISLAAVAGLISGCAYHPGTFHDRHGDWPATRLTQGCVDLALARHDEPNVAGAVIEYDVGNRCDHRVTIDLARVQAVGRTSDGRELALAAFDPRGELRPHTLAALWSGRAQIAYQHDTDAVDTICVDVAGVIASRDARWTCFARRLP